MMFEFITVLTIVVLFMLIFAETLFYNRDVEKHEQEISGYRIENARLKEVNQQLRGDLLIKQADEFARDCEAAKAGERLE